MRNWILGLGNRLPSSLAQQLKSNSRFTKVVRPVVNPLLPQGPRIARILSGAGKGQKLCVDLRSEKYLWTGSHEPHLQTALVRILKPGDVFWDIGAHIGFFSLIASSGVGPQGKVHSFEPMNQNRDRLVRSVNASDASNVEVHPEAVASFSGSAELHGHSGSPMWSLIDRDSSVKGYEVPCATIDHLVDQLGPPTLVKIDVEGGELDVLSGAAKTIQQYAPSFLVEFTDDERIQGARRLLPDYTFRHLGQNHWLLSSQTVLDS